MVRRLKAFWNEEDGAGIIEVVLILVILLAIIFIFREKIQSIVSDAFSSIEKNGNSINKGITVR